MSRTRLLCHTAAAALALGLAACGDSTAPDAAISEAQITADVAATAGDVASEDVGLITSGDGTASTLAAATAGGVYTARPVSPALASAWNLGGSCPYDSTEQRFVCATMSVGALQIDRSFALFDAAGASMTAYDDSLTASMEMTVAVSGTVTRPRWSADVSRQRSWTVSGLAGQETTRTWAGTGGGAMGITFSDGTVTRRYLGTQVTAMSSVVVQLPRSANPWPLSGTITRQVDATLTRQGAQQVSRSVSRATMVTFNGTQFVELRVGETLFTLDLATGEVTPR